MMKVHHSKHSHAEKARHLMRRSGYKVGGAVGTPSPAPVSPSPPASAPILPTRKEGGAVSGEAATARLDKFARGGHGKKKPHVTVNVMNHQPPPAIAMAPPAAMGGPGAGAPMPPGPGMGPGPAPGPGNLPPGAMPPGLKTGGKVSKFANGGAPTQGYSTSKIPEPKAEKHLARGGKTGYKFDAGAGSGEGRLQKCAAYGTKPKAK